MSSIRSARTRAVSDHSSATFVRPGAAVRERQLPGEFRSHALIAVGAVGMKYALAPLDHIGEAIDLPEDVGQSIRGAADCIRVAGCLVVNDCLLVESDRPVIGGREPRGLASELEQVGTLGPGGGHLQGLLE